MGTWWRHIVATAILAVRVSLQGAWCWRDYCLPFLWSGIFGQKGALQTFLSANIGANVTYVALVPPLRDIVYDSVVGMLAIVAAVLAIVFAILCRVQWWPRWSATSSLQAWIFCGSSRQRLMSAFQ